jgi:hypothetical protein
MQREDGRDKSGQMADKRRTFGGAATADLFQTKGSFDPKSSVECGTIRPLTKINSGSSISRRQRCRPRASSHDRLDRRTIIARWCACFVFAWLPLGRRPVYFSSRDEISLETTARHVPFSVT